MSSIFSGRNSFQESKETWVKAKSSLWVTGSLGITALTVVTLAIIGPILKHHCQQARHFGNLAQNFYNAHHQDFLSQPSLYKEYLALTEKSIDYARKVVGEIYAVIGLSTVTVGTLGLTFQHIRKIHKQRQIDATASHLSKKLQEGNSDL